MQNKYYTGKNDNVKEARAKIDIFLGFLVYQVQDSSVKMLSIEVIFSALKILL